MNIRPYLNFDGRCEEAINFYREALGADAVTMMRYKEMPRREEAAMVPPGCDDKILHSSFRVGETTMLASDGHCTGKANFQGISLALAAADDDEAKRLFTALSEGGQVQMPLGPTFFSTSFGMLVDRFGVSWMIVVNA